MKDALAKCFKGFQERYENVLETKPIYIDNLGISLPLNETTKRSRCLERAKRIDKSMRFEEEDMVKPPARKEGSKPRKVVRFQLENNKIFEPEQKEVTFDLHHEHELKRKEVRFDLHHELKRMPLEEKEGLSIVEGKEEVVRVKIKMTKQEAERLLSKRKNDGVLDFEHVIDHIAHVPIHQLQVSVVVVACNNERHGDIL